MLTLWLAAGLLSAEAAAPQEDVPVKGSYVSVERKPRKTWAQDRDELRAIIEKAMADPSSAADAVQAIAAPAVTVPGPRVIIDWGRLSRDMAALERAVIAYSERIAAAEMAARIAAENEDEDDAMAMLLAA